MLIAFVVDRILFYCDRFIALAIPRARIRAEKYFCTFNPNSSDEPIEKHLLSKCANAQRIINEQKPPHHQTQFRQTRHLIVTSFDFKAIILMNTTAPYRNRRMYYDRDTRVGAVGREVSVRRRNRLWRSWPCRMTTVVNKASWPTPTRFCSSAKQKTIMQRQTCIGIQATFEEEMKEGVIV
ncbi:hypothetical protein Tcan_18520 [Toxocara canis]|uniref:Uncharacterized protein n=1 Tax=Toxocara canis TaxID=6265 RepID=A0A0B2VWQ6_TOXCA|nr:hypothetical protein Tcan_18520 [Toxocara canis]